MSIKKTLKNIIVSNESLRKTARRILYSSQRAKYRKASKNAVTDKKLVVFCSFDGRDYSDNPKAVFECMKSDGRFEDYRFVWIFNEPEKYAFLEDSRTTLAKSGSEECDALVQQAGYWIFNFRAPDRYEPREDQIYVQCWHGTPLKRLGYDITCSGNAMNSPEEIKEKYKSDAERFDYIVSCCGFVTDKVMSAWNLEELGRKEAILETGYPRNDRLALCREGETEEMKAKLGLPPDKKVILYAPTWRDDQHDAEAGYVYESPVDFGYLKEQLSGEYVILFRAHYLVANNFDFEAYKGFIYDVSAYDDVNDLYIAADLLITDYSSVFFDYALLERPMYFYMYDIDAYQNELRGFYIDTDDLPGPVTRTEEELVTALRAGNEKTDFDSFNKEYNILNDGKASQRLVERVFGGKN